MTPKEEVLKVFNTVLNNYNDEIREKDLICKTIKEVYNNGCIGCPLYKLETERCSSMSTYPPNHSNTVKSFKDRIEFFERAIKILESLPEERFKGVDWKYFKEIFDLDKRIKNEKIASKCDIILT